MLPEYAPVHVAVSGGVDSMVLLHVLRRLGHDPHVLHVDHGLRGAESDGDNEFVQAYCAKNRIPFMSTRVDVRGHTEGKGISTQMAARELRYAWFGEQWGQRAMPIALGHHADDAVETLFIHLLRGTGAQGWSSIAPVSGIFIRPLLCVHREEIMDYAREHGIAFREDSSNAELKYQRNRIRHEVLPLLESIRPGASRTMARSIDLLRELEEAGQQVSFRDLADLRLASDGSLHIPFARITGSATPKLVLHRMLRHLDFHPDTIERIHDSIIDRATGSTFDVGSWQVLVDRDELIVHQRPSAKESYIIDMEAPGAAGPFNWSTADMRTLPKYDGMNEVFLDAARLTQPLEMRLWKDGDRMRPIGLGGSKLVSDILIDAKVPLHEKERTYVFTSAGTVVWLVGHRLAEGFQALPTSARVLRLSFGSAL
ncbi:MAG TPA: tRNA lysidine(34) synthetase TilS [Flavobacteriales bacterium]|nr:tRNA lysidine(34) synthetase TilS [Flavobacteriales bacterium]